MVKYFVLGTFVCILGVFISVPREGSAEHHNDHSRRHNSYPDADTTDDSAGSDDRPLVSCDYIDGSASQLSCQNFAQTVSRNIDTQIQMELNASYVYMVMSAYFGRDDVAYRGFAKFFSESSDEERTHAQKLIDYVLERGGRPTFKTINVPETKIWASPLAAVQDALALEHQVNHALLDLHYLAQQKNDPHLQDFLETHYLNEQVESIKQLAHWTTILRRLHGHALGVHTFDEEIYNGKR